MEQLLRQILVEVEGLRGGLDDLRSGQEELRSGLDELRRDQTEFKRGQEELRSAVDELRRDQAELKRGQEELRSGFAELKRGQEELKSGYDELKRGQEELKSGFAELKRGQEIITSRLDHHYELLRALEESVQATKATTIALSEEMNYLRGTVTGLERKLDRWTEEAATKKELKETNERVTRLETHGDWALLKIAQHDARLTFCRPCPESRAVV